MKQHDIIMSIFWEIYSNWILCHPVAMMRRHWCYINSYLQPNLMSRDLLFAQRVLILYTMNESSGCLHGTNIYSLHFDAVCLWLASNSKPQVNGIRQKNIYIYGIMFKSEILAILYICFYYYYLFNFWGRARLTMCPVCVFGLVWYHQCFIQWRVP